MKPELDHCGTCRACLDICPTAAFPEPYRLDARRCISYLTIEHKGPIPREFRAAMGNRIYGCDDCLRCVRGTSSRRKGARPSSPRARRCARRRLAELARLDDAQFRALFAKTSIKRTGRDRFVRNVLIAIGNSGDACARREAERLLDDPSPLVRGAAVWALARHCRARHSRRWRDANRIQTSACKTNGPPRWPRIPPPPRSAARCPRAATGDGRRP